MMSRLGSRTKFAGALVLAAVLGAVLYAQAPTSVQLVPPAPSQITLVPISATAAVNTQTTLTIPAPAGGLYNYVCFLAYEVGNDNTGTAVSNVVSTSTNFNAFATKFSQPATASVDSYVQLWNMQPGSGCAKSAAPGVTTTFVSSAGLTHATWTWYAVYYAGP